MADRFTVTIVATLDDPGCSFPMPHPAINRAMEELGQMGVVMAKMGKQELKTPACKVVATWKREEVNA